MALAGGGTPANAQSAKGQSSGAIETVVVTAQ